MDLDDFLVPSCFRWFGFRVGSGSELVERWGMTRHSLLLLLFRTRGTQQWRFESSISF
jgi:hypothetical protein